MQRLWQQNFWGLVRGGCLPECKGQVLSRVDFGPDRPREGTFAKHGLHSRVLKSASETKQTFPVHMCLLLAKCNFLFERKRAVKLSIAFSDIKSLLQTIDLLSINESNMHNGDLPSFRNGSCFNKKSTQQNQNKYFFNCWPLRIV